MIGIIDYEMGNLRSVQKALEYLEINAEILTSPSQLAQHEGVILPGVGAFRDAIAEIRKQEFDKAIHDYVDSGKPLLGICLGLQLLFDVSYEEGTFEGLGIVKGDVTRFTPEPGLKIPHMGWNTLDIRKPSTLFDGEFEGRHVYFVHSYFVRPQDESVIAAQTTHGTQTFTSAISAGNVHATQFHPEKSQQVGLHLLRNFANLVTNQPQTA